MQPVDGTQGQARREEGVEDPRVIRASPRPRRPRARTGARAATPTGRIEPAARRPPLPPTSWERVSPEIPGVRRRALFFLRLGDVPPQLLVAVRAVPVVGVCPRAHLAGGAALQNARGGGAVRQQRHD